MRYTVLGVLLALNFVFGWLLWRDYACVYDENVCESSDVFVEGEGDDYHHEKCEPKRKVCSPLILFENI